MQKILIQFKECYSTSHKKIQIPGDFFWLIDHKYICLQLYTHVVSSMNNMSA